MPDSDPSRPQEVVGVVKDARGRRLAQLDPVTMHLLRRHEVIDAETLRLLAQESAVRRPRIARLLFWASVIGAVALLVVLVGTIADLIRSALPLNQVFLRLAPFVGIWVAPFLLWQIMRAARSSRVTAVMLRHRRCPHCGYDLRGLGCDADDGATVCPECGGAWRLGDATAAKEPNHAQG